MSPSALRIIPSAHDGTSAMSSHNLSRLKLESASITTSSCMCVAGYYYNVPGKPSYYSAVYEFLTEDTGCEAEFGLLEVSGVEFMDEGHAIEWAR